MYEKIFTLSFFTGDSIDHIFRNTRESGTDLIGFFDYVTFMCFDAIFRYERTSCTLFKEPSTYITQQYKKSFDKTSNTIHKTKTI